jgi:hypothetical protein
MNHQDRITQLLTDWNVPRNTYDISFLQGGEIVVKAGGQTVKILSTGEIYFRDKYLCNVPESAVPHLVAGIVLALYRN